MDNINFTEFEHNGLTYGVAVTSTGRKYIKLHDITNLDMKNMTEDEFCSLMLENLPKICEKYNSLVKEEVENCKINSRNLHMKWLREYAEKKWKTEKKRNEYVNTEMAKYDAKENYVSGSKIGFVLWPGSHDGYPAYCGGMGEKSTRESLHLAWNFLKDNNWFRKGIGLRFQYFCYGEDRLRQEFGGEIDVIMNEADKQAELAAQKAVDDAISSYYANKRPGEYCGD